MLKPLLRLFVFLPVILITTGCGAIFYPERSDNTHKIDPRIAVADGIGLVFFVLPGVVAYAVDFSTGCIYLEGNSAPKTQNATKYRPSLNLE